MRAPVPPDDAARVAALQRLGILDRPPAPDLEGLTRLATYVTGAPVGVVNLIDTDRQWQAAATGMACGQFPRDDSMCAHVVAAGVPVHVADASLDPRFADGPFVTGVVADVRMYASLPLRDTDGYAVGTLCVVDPVARTLEAGQFAALRDIAAQAEALLELRRQHVELVGVLAEVDHYATHDALTGLVNRRLLVDRLEQALNRAQRSGRPPTVFFCDLDGFKAVNDAFGHDAGDEVLVAVSRRLRSLVRPTDTVARLGGDEFVVVCEDLPDDMVFDVADRLRRTGPADLGAPAGCPPLGISVGTVTAALPSTAGDVLRLADRLMYADKASRRSR
ncbi:diguanylate cyclase (GGDEF)-like protein [Kineococcus xinjiangensis]|uniref:Diguanylate cyclase (GGDEF)-like protein n=1 Tax=Kineococcus xinjiangensis TaxID=512762 RepID=A0A2S6IDJ8_9ACTN|nr:sensor domain-containing diguanylate cyclase [Kineococcus xinjiangensis]PPK92298.1 diguanylate cyclase (GGDEF)-like protein [Kineococcus xinjiangensis]